MDWKNIQRTRLRSVRVTFAAALLAASMSAWAQPGDQLRHDKSMAETMPRIQPGRILTVMGNENWDELTGFGSDAPMVAMMNLMMVGGSGMEGTKMPPMQTGAEMNGKPMTPGNAPGTISIPGMSGTSGMSIKGETEGAGRQMPAGLSVEATVTPNPPVVGDNTVTFRVGDSKGEPITGAKLSAKVFMTSMDMGITRPVVKELGGGRYQVTAQFSMAGPWRLTLSGSGIELPLDFDAGGRMNWAQPGAPATSSAVDSVPDATSSSERNVPRPGSEQPAVPGQALLAAAISPNPPIVGTNTLYVRIREAQAAMPLTGLRLAMGVGSTSTGVHTGRPAVKELGNGWYASNVVFDSGGPWRVAVTGYQPGGSKPFVSVDLNFLVGRQQKWAPPPGVATATPPELRLAAILSKPRAGDNLLDVVLVDEDGRPVTGAKFVASVAMRSMNMGTTHPTVKDNGTGHYRATVNFSMLGPWRVTLTATPPGGTALTRSFDFDVKQ